MMPVVGEPVRSGRLGETFLKVEIVGRADQEDVWRERPRTMDHV